MSEMKTYLEEHAHDRDNIVMVTNEQVETWEDVLESIKIAIKDYAEYAYIARQTLFYVGIEVMTQENEHHLNTIGPYELYVKTNCLRNTYGERVFDEEIVEPTANKLLFALKKVVPDSKDITKVVVYATEIVVDDKQ